MASVDELSSQIEALKGEIEQTAASAGASMSGAEELSNQTAAIGMEGKAAEAMQVKEGLEQIQTGLQGIAQQAEGVRAQVEAMRGLKGGTGGGVPAGGAEANAPTPAGGKGGSGGGEGPIEPPTGGPPAVADDGDSGEPEKFEFVPWFPDEVSADRVQNQVGDPVKAPESIDPADDSRLPRLRRLGRGAVRSADDLRGYSNEVEKSKNDIGDLFKPPLDPHSYPSSVGTSDAPSFSRPVGDDTPDPTDVWGTGIMMAATAVEAASRLVHRRSER